MTYLQCNNSPVVRAVITMPQIGAWYAEIAMDSQNAPSGLVNISTSDNGGQWSGYAYRAGVFRDTVMARVVGGAGGLATALAPKFYRNAPLRLPLSDALVECGERLSVDSSQEILNRQLVSWTRAKGLGGEAVRALIESAGASWRVLSDGSVWVGVESWPDISIDYELISESPNSGCMEIWSDSLSLKPGVAFHGRRVTKVEHRIEDRVRTTIWFDGAEQSSADDPMVAIESLVRNLTSHIDYFAQYPARVVKQNDDLSLELQPDDSRLPGLSRVPIRLGIPGIRVKVNPGARVAVEFAAGNPSNPVATVWEASGLNQINIDAAVDVVVNGGSKSVARVADKVDLGLWSFVGQGAITVIQPDGQQKMLSGGVAQQITASISSGAEKFHA